MVAGRQPQAGDLFAPIRAILRVVTGSPRIASISPRYAAPGGRVTVEGGPFAVSPELLPVVRVGGQQAALSFARSGTLKFFVPRGAEAGRQPVRIEEAAGETAFLDVAEVVAEGVHAVDSPAVAADGTIYVTCSGSRGQQTPVSVYRCTLDGRREIFVTGIANATSLAFDPLGRLHVTSRFDGTVSRIDAEGRPEVVASDLGIACGLSFAPDGTMFVGDRSGTIFAVPPGGDPEPIATLPPSVAAFHLALSPAGDWLYVSGPTLAPTDVVYRVSRDGRVETACAGFGRPQGLAVDQRGRVFVVDAAPGVCGVYAIDSGAPRLVVAAAQLVGVALDHAGGLVLTSNDLVYRLQSFDV